MSKTKYDENTSYEIFDNGYKIFHKGTTYAQFDIYSKMFIPDGTYEENAIEQIKSIIKAEQEDFDRSTQEKINQANIDYIALMLDVDLPNQEEEPVTEEEGE